MAERKTKKTNPTEEIGSIKPILETLRIYFQWRGLNPELSIVKGSFYEVGTMLELFRRVVSEYPDCAIDIAGGSDAALFAAGYFCRETDIPVFTHSRKKQKFFAINNADFAHHLPFSVQYSVQDFFLMAYGDVKPGRVTNDALVNREDMIDRFFTIFMKYRKKWNHIVTWFQRASQPEKNGEISLSVRSDYYVKGERGSRIPANKEALKDFERRQHIWWDYNAVIQSAFRRGKRKGIASRMKAKGIAIKDIAEITGLNSWEIEAL